MNRLMVALGVLMLAAVGSANAQDNVCDQYDCRDDPTLEVYAEDGLIVVVSTCVPPSSLTFARDEEIRPAFAIEHPRRYALSDTGFQRVGWYRLSRPVTSGRLKATLNGLLQVVVVCDGPTCNSSGCWNYCAARAEGICP